MLYICIWVRINALEARLYGTFHFGRRNGRLTGRRGWSAGMTEKAGLATAGLLTKVVTD